MTAAEINEVPAATRDLAKLMILKFKNVHDASKYLDFVSEPAIVDRNLGETVSRLLEVVTQAAFVVRHVAAGANSGVELVLEIGVTVSEQVPFDVGLVGERDDGERAVGAKRCSGQEPVDRCSDGVAIGGGGLSLHESS
jgi:hypothetical protein